MIGLDSVECLLRRINLINAGIVSSTNQREYSNEDAIKDNQDT